jgi:diguanylate cyclase (GGDEF)-like protein
MTIVIAVCISIVAVDTWRAIRAQQLQLHEGELAGRNLSQAVAQYTTGALRESDAVLVGLVDRLQSDGISPDSLRRIQSLLLRYTAGMPLLQRLTIIDSRGRWLTTSQTLAITPVDVSDRDYFKHHRDSAETDAYLGPPIRSKSSNRWILTLTRRFNRPDDSFGGVVVASIDYDYFNRFFERFDIGEHGVLVLAAADGTILDRRPYRDDLIGSKLARDEMPDISITDSGLTTRVSPVDGVERQLIFQSLERYPLFVAVSLSTSELLAGWKTDTILQAAFIALFVATLAIVGLRLVAQGARRAVTETDLRRSQADLEAMNRRLEVVAREDALTALASRRELDRVLAIECVRAHRAHAPIGLVMLDVDHFKGYNDRYGHATGDECLRDIGRAIASCVGRGSDLAARYGGEEFAVVLPGVDAPGAAAVAEKIWQAVRDLHLAHEGSPKGIVTISAGVASLIAEGAPIAPDELIRRADAALYKAKRAGRDAVRLDRSPRDGDDEPRAESAPRARA